MISGSEVGQDEVLYRSVRDSEITIEAGRIKRLSSTAFADRNFEVSVNRAAMHDHDPERTRKRSTDKVVPLIAYEVKGIPPISYMAVNPPITHRIDVIPRPNPPAEPDNDAHAVIYGVPAFQVRTPFKKLLERLCKLAEGKMGI